MFKDSAEAIKWAEVYSAKSNVKSQIGNLMKKSSGGEPVFDIALSISARVAECTPKVNALALKCIYGAPDRTKDEILGEMIGERLIAICPGCGKSREQLNRLGYVTVKAERAFEVYGDKYPLKRMAYDIGVSRQQFCNATRWLEARAESMNMLRNWVASGRREIELWLDEHDWFDTGYIEEMS